MLKFKSKSILGVLFALGAAIVTFNSEMDSLNKDKEIEDLKKRITKLEDKGAK